MEYAEGIQYLRLVQSKISRSIVPLYIWDEAKKYPQFLGSSVYFNIGLNGMLFTAFHVINDSFPKKLLCLLDDNIIGELPCDGFHTHKEKDFDIGVLELKEKLKMWSMYDASNLGIFNDNPGYQHLLLGYPWSYTKHSDRNKQEVKLEGYLTDAASDKEYERLRKSKNDYALLKFQKENVYDENQQKINFPNPNGMSGGAVVQINENNLNDIRIIGIMNEWDIVRKNTVISTRIERYFDLFSSMKKIWLSPSPSWLGR